jgi:hypothetical protein
VCKGRGGQVYKGGGKGVQVCKGGVEGGRCIAATNSYKVSHDITLFILLILVPS